MKKIYLFIAAAAALVMACSPIEDQTLREKYVTNAGTPITKAELTKAISVTQPYPNEDGKVEGDQIVVLKNSRPDVGGAWHVQTAIGEKVIKSDSYTYTYESNGEFEIYYAGISANSIVESEHIKIKVTNVFDPWAGYLTGAVDKADKTAKKTWSWREVSWGSICNMGAHGGWKYTTAGYTPESNFCWWANYTLEKGKVGEERMVFAYNGSKMTTYNPDGTVKAEGTFGFNKTAVEDLVLGLLITSAPTIGARFDDCGQGESNEFYLLTFDKKYITIYHNGWGGSEDWGDCGWYAYFQAVE